MPCKTCACGCGQALTEDRWRNRPTYAKGHFWLTPAGAAARAKGRETARANAARNRTDKLAHGLEHLFACKTRRELVAAVVELRRKAWARGYSACERKWRTGAA